MYDPEALGPLGTQESLRAIEVFSSGDACPSCLSGPGRGVSEPARREVAGAVLQGHGGAARGGGCRARAARRPQQALVRAAAARGGPRRHLRRIWKACR